MTNKTTKLSELLSEITKIDSMQDCVISGLTLDSRKIKKGDLFFACIGENLDGRDFIAEAVHKGAVAVLCEDELPVDLNLSEDVPVIIINNLKWQVGPIAARFYDYPAKKLTMIGVTGTNGKTSITHYLAQILNGLNYPCGVIGTNGIGYLSQLNSSINTTPDPITLHQKLFEFVESGAKTVAMEVSSQGLVQGRVSGIDFAIGVFTNLTHEHLDYHKTIESYWEAKKLMFLRNNVKYAVINFDDEYGRNMVEELEGLADVYGYSLAGQCVGQLPCIAAQSFELKPDITTADIVTPWGQSLLRSALLGRFSLSNLLAVVTVLGMMNFKLDQILEKISELKSVIGRMQVFGGKNQLPMVVVDYSHSPDALEKSLLALRDYSQGSLWCVFGCGGDRDRSKRPLMGEIAEHLSDHIVITSDNPRTEDPKQIVDDILAGLLCPWAVEIEYDREVAIEYAINNAAANDVILIAGKGHEEYQIIGKTRKHFSDQEVVERVLSSKK